MEKFEKLYEQLNAEQRQAVDTIDGPVIVVAGPGTGKTQVLSMRIANILKKTDTPAHAILALTFTESAAASMKRRLVDMIGYDGYGVTITTFHSFANAIIKEYPEYFPEIIGSDHASEADQLQLLKQIIDSREFKELKPFGDRYYYVRALLSTINHLKREGISDQQFADMMRQEEVDAKNGASAYAGAKSSHPDAKKFLRRNKELAIVYREYQKLLRKNHQYDYNDMIMQTVLALQKHAALLQEIQEKYLYVLVDEHQDTNRSQHTLLELLVKHDKKPNLFLVGDGKQAIFRFQGGNSQGLMRMQELYPEALVVLLFKNYRSTQTILDASHSFLPRQVPLEAMAKHPAEPLVVAPLSSVDREHGFVAKTIKELIKKSVPAEEIAVLYRENREAAPLAMVLEKYRVPFSIESDQDVLDDEDIQKFLVLCNAVRHFGSPPELVDVLHLGFLGIDPLDSYQLLAYSQQQRVNPYEVLRSKKLLEQAGIRSPNIFLDLYARLAEWKKDSKSNNPQQVLEHMVSDSGFLAHLLSFPITSGKREKLYDFFEHLRSLSQKERSYTLEKFFDHLDLLSEYQVAMRNSEPVVLPGRVRLMTVHKAKGLEFEHVFIMNAVEGKWEARQNRELLKLPAALHSQGAGNQEQDEKNLFYVALTRAKKHIYISYGAKNSEGREQLPTKFLQHIDQQFLSTLDTKPYEKVVFTKTAPTTSQRSRAEEKKLVQRLFAVRGLSATAVNNYLACPWKYFYVDLLRIPLVSNRHMAYGSAMHAALKNYFDALKKTPKEKKYLLDAFRENIMRQPASSQDISQMRAKGLKALSRYYDRYGATWNHAVVSEFQVSSMIGKHTKILGKIDKIEFLEEGANAVRVVDYKTGKPKSKNAVMGKTKTGDGNYYRQLLFYSLLLKKIGTFKPVSGQIDFIESDEKAKYHKYEFEMHDSELVSLEKEVKRIAKEIRNFSFQKQHCNDPNCYYCNLRKSMVLR